MKWGFLLLFGVMCWGGFFQHPYNEEIIKETTKELLEENGCSSVGIDGINLPISYTFLSKKVDSDVFFTTDDDYRSVIVTVTPIESFPIISIFISPAFTISMNPFFSLISC